MWFFFFFVFPLSFFHFNLCHFCARVRDKDPTLTSPASTRGAAGSRRAARHAATFHEGWRRAGNCQQWIAADKLKREEGAIETPWAEALICDVSVYVPREDPRINNELSASAPCSFIAGDKNRFKAVLAGLAAAAAAAAAWTQLREENTRCFLFARLERNDGRKRRLHPRTECFEITTGFSSLSSFYLFFSMYCFEKWNGGACAETRLR